MENPYASPSGVAHREEAQRPQDNGSSASDGHLSAVATITIVMCGLWFAMIFGGRFLEDNPPPPRELLGFYVTASIAPALSLYGAICTLRRERYPIAMTGAFCLCIPLFGPCGGLTIPLGVWALVLLRRKEVRQTFDLPTATLDIAEDAEKRLARAAALDASGDWDAAIALYSEAGAQCPEYADYANNCIEAIRRKQAAGDRN
ncbi:MAG: hypothetical protein KY475_23845 [Planctomycetes bacterium]|nr:hypothetical protein [Planctomycetota bacterium]